MFSGFRTAISNISAGLKNIAAQEHTPVYVKALQDNFAHDLSAHGCSNFTVPEALGDAFPDDVAPTRLMHDFGLLISAVPRDSLGFFEITNTEYVTKLLPVDASGSGVESDFALFLHTPDGGLAGLWLRDNRDAATAPFVFLDSEGSFEVLAPSFTLFLDRLSKELFSEHGFSDFLPAEVTEPDDDDNPINLSSYLRDWLKGHPDVGKKRLKAAPASYDDIDDGSAQQWLVDFYDKYDAAQ